MGSAESAGPEPLGAPPLEADCCLSSQLGAQLQMPSCPTPWLRVLSVTEGPLSLPVPSAPEPSRKVLYPRDTDPTSASAPDPVPTPSPAPAPVVFSDSLPSTSHTAAAPGVVSFPLPLDDPQGTVSCPPFSERLRRWTVPFPMGGTLMLHQLVLSVL